MSQSRFCHRTRASSAACWAFAAVLPWCAIAPAQQPAPSGETAKSTSEPAPLSLKQKMIQDRFDRFEDRLYRLQADLEAVEPANAARLGRALERAGELGLSDQLDKISELLGRASTLHQAEGAQSDWMKEAEAVLAILMERDTDNEERRSEIERLQAIKQSLDGILRDEREARDDASRAALEARLRQQLDQAIARVQAMRNRQGNLSQQAQDGPATPEANTQSAEEQERLAEDAQRLAEDLKRLGELEPEKSSDSTTQEQAREAAKKAGGSVGEAQQSMSGASKSLQGGEKGAAKTQQDAAAQALDKALEELEKAKKELDGASKPGDIADKQDALADRAKKLADEMRSGGEEGSKDGSPQEGQPGQDQPQKGQPGEKPDGQKGPQQGGQQGQQQGGQQQGQQKGGPQKGGSPKGGPKPTPGAEGVEDAEDEMRGAAEELEEGKPEEAVPRQDKAIEQLEQAQRELEKALNQLRKEERAEKLRELEFRFRDMLGKQRTINDGTVALDLPDRTEFTRAERLRLADLASQEKGLGDEARACLRILEEDATTLVFPRVVDQLATDMDTVSTRLADLQVGELTQKIEKEIVETLEQLIGAVQKMQQENQEGGGQGPSANQENQPLLPTSAELKLLRASQLRVNERTETIARTRESGGEPAESVEAALRSVSERQRDVRDIAKEMRDRQPVP